MSEFELYKKIHDQILDYADDEMIARCARWGYAVQQKIDEHKMFLVQAGAEEIPEFIYAVATAVIIGEFAKRAYNDHFSDEVGIDLDLLDINFEQIRGFLEKNIEPDRLEFLEGGNVVGLQDMWAVTNEWKQHIHQSLIVICKEQGKGDPIDRIFTSLITVFEERDEETHKVSVRNIGAAGELSAYSYTSDGFR